MANSLESLTAYTPQKKNILKPKKVAVFVAPMSVEMPLTITTGGTPVGTPITLKELTGFEPIGLLRKDDGVPRSRDREKSDVMAIGYDDPVRSDFTSDVMSAQIVALETRKTTIEKFLGVDLSAVVPDPATGEISFPQLNTGQIDQNRWLFLAQDGIGLARKWWGWGFSAGVVGETDDQNLGSTDDPWMWPMTISSETDTELGWGVHHYNAGPGWKASLADMGFAVA
jgi:hypothetical protein